jgi:hypothetical protein
MEFMTKRGTHDNFPMCGLCAPDQLDAVNFARHSHEPIRLRDANSEFSVRCHRLQRLTGEKRSFRQKC